MDGPLARLTDADLLYLSDRLAPGADRGRMLRVLREDEDILRAMVADERLLRMLTDEPEGLLCVSPRPHSRPHFRFQYIRMVPAVDSLWL